MISDHVVVDAAGSRFSIGPDWWSPRSLMVTEQWTVSSEAERLSLLLSTGEQAAVVSSPDIDHKSISSSY